MIKYFLKGVWELEWNNFKSKMNKNDFIIKEFSAKVRKLLTLVDNKTFELIEVLIYIG